MPTAILFDLDGTLIDSSPGILASFARVLAAHGLQAAVPLEASLIGPPLAVTLRRISGIGDAALLARLVEAFKQDYDTAGYRDTRAFDGVAEGLARLAGAGAQLFIVTNKRIVPTLKILESLGLARHFTGVHTRDETEPMAPSKAAVTQRVLVRHGIDPRNACFVGDSDEDAAAARDNGLRFIHATYGYGAAGIQSRPDAVLEQFARLSDLIAALPREGCEAAARP